jgi:hypothetical protein
MMCSLTVQDGQKSAMSRVKECGLEGAGNLQLNPVGSQCQIKQRNAYKASESKRNTRLSEQVCIIESHRCMIYGHFMAEKIGRLLAEGRLTG